MQRRFAKKKKGSKQRYKVLQKIRREYERIGNQKSDKVNKIVAFLLKKYDRIYIQNENIVGWHKGLFGKQVQHSALVAIKSKIISLESANVIGRYEPTTKLCYVCGVSNGQIKYEIQAKTDGSCQGKMVDRYKTLGFEGEVLYPPYSKFEVVEVVRGNKDANPPTAAAN